MREVKCILAKVLQYFYSDVFDTYPCPGCGDDGAHGKRRRSQAAGALHPSSDWEKVKIATNL